MKTLSLLIAVAALAGSAAAEKTDRCLRTSLIDGFKNATDSSVVLTARRDDYLVETVGTCIGLREVLGLSVKAATSCLGVGDSLIFNSAGGMSQRCMISSIARVEKDAPQPKPDDAAPSVPAPN